MITIFFICKSHVYKFENWNGLQVKIVTANLNPVAKLQLISSLN